MPWYCIHVYTVTVLVVTCFLKGTSGKGNNETYPYQTSKEYDIIYHYLPSASPPNGTSLLSFDNSSGRVETVGQPLDCGSVPHGVNTDNVTKTLMDTLCKFNLSEPNSSGLDPDYLYIPTHYSIMFAAVAATLSAIIFLFGILGNILVIIVIARTRSMHTTTNCYLLSLAVADSLVLLSGTLPAIPEPFFRVDEWPFGRVMCSLLIFLQNFGIDGSSLSITAFTIERYIAICHPMRAQTMCTVSRAKRILAILWIFTLLYCSPWLGLTEIREVRVSNGETIPKCQYRFARSSYLVLYMIDLILFYVIPLIIATVLYLLIARILYLSRAVRKNDQCHKRRSPKKNVKRRADSRVQVVRMLVVVVVAFATLWMPYRVMVVYNSFAQLKYMDLWFLLFARTMVYVNCAINPVLYNIMSVKFKRAFRNHLSCCHRRNHQRPVQNYTEVITTDVWATKRPTQTNNPYHKRSSSDNRPKRSCSHSSNGPGSSQRENTVREHSPRTQRMLAARGLNTAEQSV